MNDRVLPLLEGGFKRIFSLPVTQMTYREVFNLVMVAAEGDKEVCNRLLEALGTKKMYDKWTEAQKEQMRKLSDNYALSIRIAREVMDRGEFLSLLTTDVVDGQQQQQPMVFLNRIRRVDGEGFHFLTDPLATAQLIAHFISRLSDLKESDAGLELLNKLSGDLGKVRDLLDDLVEDAKTAKKLAAKR